MIPHSTASTREPSEEAVQKEKVIEDKKKEKKGSHHSELLCYLTT